MTIADLLYELGFKKARIHSNNPSIGIDYEKNSLDIILDLNVGMLHHEEVSISRLEKQFSIMYSGMIDVASQTFLPEGYQEEIQVSQVLSSLKGQVVSGDQKKVTENGQEYSPFLMLEEQTQEYEEVLKSVEFFLRVFERKSQN